MSAKLFSLLVQKPQPVPSRNLSVHPSVCISHVQDQKSFCVENPEPLMEDLFPRSPHWGLENTKELLVDPSIYQPVKSWSVAPNHQLGSAQKTL